MLKSVVPSFCSVAFIIGLPSAANPGRPPSAPATNVLYTSNNGKHAKFSQTNKLALSASDEKQGMKFVSSYIRDNDECLVNVRERSEEPFAIIDSVLRHYGLPLQLKYLAVIESELKPTALSRVGAKGPWQLMPHTAHVLGLKVNRHSDERMNFYKSTKAAAKYLRDLHKQFGDWLLVLAAYNGGPRPVYRAIHKSHSRNFWALQNYLPAESREHVKKFIATTYYFEGDESARSPQTSTSTASQRDTEASPAPMSPKGPTLFDETDNERFLRLMHKSAQSLKTSHELLGSGN
ncbi:MAG TPA: lytic transglycosylase domain-containing protein [Puia sp.]|nr:lytic transglycosylase domain-containing protein [Puia sp.]